MMTLNKESIDEIIKIVKKKTLIRCESCRFEWLDYFTVDGECKNSNCQKVKYYPGIKEGIFVNPKYHNYENHVEYFQEWRKGEVDGRYCHWWTDSKGNKNIKNKRVLGSFSHKYNSDDGIILYFDEFSGQKIEQCNYIEGELEYILRYYEDGQKSHKEFYKNGKIISGKYWNEDGSLESIENYNEDGSLKK